MERRVLPFPFFTLAHLTTGHDLPEFASSFREAKEREREREGKLSYKQVMERVITAFIYSQSLGVERGREIYWIELN